MAFVQSRDHKKGKSGARKVLFRDKRKEELGRPSAKTKVGERKVKKQRVLAGHAKTKLQSCDWVNLLVGGKAKKSKILTVVENNANRQYVRRNRISKGAILKTEDGDVRVTNRPGQEGFINAVLVEKKQQA